MTDTKASLADAHKIEKNKKQNKKQQKTKNKKKQNKKKTQQQRLYFRQLRADQYSMKHANFIKYVFVKIRFPHLISVEWIWNIINRLEAEKQKCFYLSIYLSMV